MLLQSLTHPYQAVLTLNLMAVKQNLGTSKSLPCPDSAQFLSNPSDQ